MRIAIIGIGQLGSDLVDVLRDGGHEVFPLRRPEVDITDPVRTAVALKRRQPDIVINTAAKHDLHGCEEYPGMAFLVNAESAHTLAETCRDIDARLVQISTNYVFAGDNDRPYDEDDLACPVQMYGVTKLAGECLTMAADDRTLIVRLAGLYGQHPPSGKPENFVQMVLRRARVGEKMQMVSDQIISPTYTLDAARAVQRLVEHECSGVYHVASDGECSWYEFAVSICHTAGIKCDIAPIHTAWGNPRRPLNGLLSTAKAQLAGVQMRHWGHALEEYLHE